ncbi:hypothetical protein D9M71_235020 [compost metagenome]
MHACLTLIGEEEVPLSVKEQIIYTLEAFTSAMRQEWLDAFADGVENKNPVLVVGNEDSPVTMDFQTVRPAIVFSNQIPVSLRGNAKDSAIRDIRDIEIAGLVEGGPLQEARNLLAWLVGSDPVGIPIAPKLFRQSAKDFGWAFLGRGIQAHGKSPCENRHTTLRLKREGLGRSHQCTLPGISCCFE